MTTNRAGQTKWRLSSRTFPQGSRDILRSSSPTIRRSQLTPAKPGDLSSRADRSSSEIELEGRPRKLGFAGTGGGYIVAKLVSENPTITAFQRELAESHYLLGLDQSNLSRFDKALQFYESSRDLLETLCKNNPNNSRFFSDC